MGEGGGWGWNPTRTLLSVGLAALLGAGAGALITLTTDGGDPSETRPGGQDTEQAEAPPTTDPGSVPDLEDAVQVVETGFTAASREYCQNAADQDTSDGCYGCTIAEGCAVRPPHVSHQVSYGVILRNDSDHLLQQVPLTAAFVDSAGRPISTVEMEIGRLLPGEMLGLGNITDLESGGAADMTVEVGHGRPMSVDYAKAMADLAGLYELTASEIGLLRSSSTGPPGAWTVRFVLQESVPDGLASGDERARLFARPQVVYRDASNRIIGGTAAESMEIDESTVGLNEVVVNNYDLAFPTIDPARTEVYFTEFGVA